VTVVGYTPDYWILQNSWGSDWGNAGYMYLSKGGFWTDPHHEAAAYTGYCGVTTFVTYVVDGKIIGANSAPVSDSRRRRCYSSTQLIGGVVLLLLLLLMLLLLLCCIIIFIHFI